MPIEEKAVQFTTLNLPVGHPVTIPDENRNLQAASSTFAGGFTSRAVHLCQIATTASM